MFKKSFGILVCCLFIVPMHAKLIARRSTYGSRTERSPVHYTYVMDENGYTHPQPCCPWRYDGANNSASADLAEAQQLRESLRDDLDSATYQDDWQWKERRIRDLETRLGHIVDWAR